MNKATLYFLIVLSVACTSNKENQKMEASKMKSEIDSISKRKDNLPKKDLTFSEHTSSAPDSSWLPVVKETFSLPVLDLPCVFRFEEDHMATKFFKPWKLISEQQTEMIFKNDDHWIIPPYTSYDINYPEINLSYTQPHWGGRINSNGEFSLALFTLSTINVTKIYLVSISKNAEIIDFRTIYSWKDMVRLIESEISKEHILTIGERRISNTDELSGTRSVIQFKIHTSGKFEQMQKERSEEVDYEKIQDLFKSSPLEK